MPRGRAKAKGGFVASRAQYVHILRTANLVDVRIFDEEERVALEVLLLQLERLRRGGQAPLHLVHRVSPAEWGAGGTRDRRRARPAPHSREIHMLNGNERGPMVACVVAGCSGQRRTCSSGTPPASLTLLVVEAAESPPVDFPLSVRDILRCRGRLRPQRRAGRADRFRAGWGELHAVKTSRSAVATMLRVKVAAHRRTRASTSSRQMPLRPSRTSRHGSRCAV